MRLIRFRNYVKRKRMCSRCRRYPLEGPCIQVQSPSSTDKCHNTQAEGVLKANCKKTLYSQEIDNQYEHLTNLLLYSHCSHNSPYTSITEHRLVSQWHIATQLQKGRDRSGTLWFAEKVQTRELPAVPGS